MGRDEYTGQEEKHTQRQGGTRKQNAFRNQQFWSARRRQCLWKCDDIGQLLKGKIWGPICCSREFELHPEERKSQQTLLLLGRDKIFLF